MKVFHPLRFAGYYQGHLPLRVLGCDARGTVAGMAGLRLYATQGKHKPPGTVTPVGTQCQDPHHVKAADDFAARTQSNFRAQLHPAQSVVHQVQALQHGHTHVVGKLQRSCSRAAF